MEKQLLKLDVLFPLPYSLNFRDGNRQMRELGERAVHLEAWQLFPIRSNPTCLPPSGICHTIRWERSEKGSSVHYQGSCKPALAQVTALRPPPYFSSVLTRSFPGCVASCRSRVFSPARPVPWYLVHLFQLQ